MSEPPPPSYNEALTQLGGIEGIHAAPQEMPPARSQVAAVPTVIPVAQRRPIHTETINPQRRKPSNKIERTKLEYTAEELAEAQGRKPSQSIARTSLEYTATVVSSAGGVGQSNPVSISTRYHQDGSER